ncbi:hypothetical protein NBH00_06100 [Paraconexibacter antarcticus]|uniref:Uncharacterized protein n=1 Tax=Paraconexibacter antarcticus TaxID=2949664 RepID=A0ABY5DYZ5_9ACTN|nr:hypothetical protein [Paraconexibacter antarcticus]UTI65784.1 hypothetical protein NBH00_06100 [Paraconexibacter antarcticus]
MTSAGGLSAPAAAATAATKAATTAHLPAGKAASAFHDALASASDKLSPVKGHAYSKIVSGPDKGMYVNTTHNARAGEHFSIEYHDGRRWNVYGTGADRTIIAFPKAAAATAGTTAKPGTTTTPAGATPSTGGTSPSTKTATTGTKTATPSTGTTTPSTKTATPSTGTTTTAPTFDGGTIGAGAASTARPKR